MPIIETPYWWETDHLNFSKYFFKDNNTKRTYDLAIVGGGFTGLSEQSRRLKLVQKLSLLIKQFLDRVLVQEMVGCLEHLIKLVLLKR